MELTKLIKYLENEFNFNIIIDENINCLICHDNFNSSNSYIRLPCKCSNSIFHSTCIAEWINIKKNINDIKCPYCQKKFIIPLLCNSTEYIDEDDIYDSKIIINTYIFNVIIIYVPLYVSIIILYFI